MFRRPLTTFLVAGLLGLAACGSDSGSGTTDTIPAGAVSVIAEDGLHWNANAYQATSAGGKVTIAAGNKSSLAHNLYVVSADGTKNPTWIDLPNHKTVVKQFDLAPGIYHVVCLVPGHSTMNSTLTVS